MRATVLLLCLALARDIAGSIFRHEYYPEMERLYLQPMEFTEQQHQKRMVDGRTYREDHHNHKLHQHRDSSGSSESKERSREDSNPDSAAPQAIKTWNTPIFSAIVSKDDTRPTYGDVISWNGIQIAAGPNSPVRDQKDIEKIFKDAYKTMKHLSEEEKKKFHETFKVVNKIENEDVHLNASQLLKKHQYHVEEHTVKTDDGYLLTMFRIAPKIQENTDSKEEIKPKAVVLLSHGLLGSADDWLLMEPEHSLAYKLADQGHEVWLGNTRGNKYSRHHTSKHEALPDFWHYSNDEIALHDMPAMIDHALKTSEQKQLHHVGISQGVTAIIALTASRPEYNDKIASIHALSPMVYMTNVRSPLLRMMAPNSPFYEHIEQQLGSGEFKPSRELIRTAGGDMCENEVGCKNVCSNVNFAMSSLGDVEAELIPVIMGHLPAGGSTWQMKHYGQNVASHEFRKFDYGPEINQKVYGQPQPPKYKISNVQVPVTLYSSENDWLSHPKDVERLHKELPNVREHFKVADDQFTHMDFQFSKKAPKVVYEKLIESIEQQQTH